MKRNAIYLILIFTSILLSCEEEKLTPLKGDIIGFVTLMDEFGQDVPDRSGVNVTLDEDHSATSDSSGKFKFTGVEAGSYQLMFEKEGYGTYKTFNYGFTGGPQSAVIQNITLFQQPTIEIQTIDVELINNGLRVSGTITETLEYNFVYYFSKSPSVSSINYEYNFGHNACCLPMTSFSHSFSLGSTFNPGETIYMTVYAKNPSREYNQSYYDYELEKTIYPDLKRLIDAVEIKLK